MTLHRGLNDINPRRARVSFATAGRRPRRTDTSVSLLDKFRGILWTLLFALVLGTCPIVWAQTAILTPFNFILDEPCKTSAGVFLPDGTLVRTLWNKVRYYAPGTYSAVWDGLDNNSNAVSSGTYQIKVLQHNTEYVWDGAIGNTSQAASGPSVHSAFYTMRGMAFSGTNGYYTTGYQEGRYLFNNFSINNPQVVLNKFGGPIPDANGYFQIATDGDLIYCSCPATVNPTNTTLQNYTGCIITFAASNLTYVTLPAAVVITNNSFSGIYVGTQGGLSGLSVQVTNIYLAASSRGDNMVYIYNKLSGVLVTKFAVNSPTGLCFSPDGRLWVASTNAVYDFINVATQPSVTATISGLVNALAVAVCPTNSDLILVADGGGATNIGGGSQQIKAFNSTGAPLWTYGLAGGYVSNGPTVSINKFMFCDENENIEWTFIAFAPDGSFWVGDGGNHRALHFSESLNYLEQIMYQPHSYSTCVDQNNSSRVFNQYLEFSVDYTKPLSNAWTLVNNWKPPAANYGTYYNFAPGLREVVTLTNGRTYGLMQNLSIGGGGAPEVFELATNGIRFTGVFPGGSNAWHYVSLDTQGNSYYFTPSIATWYESPLMGFDGNKNPTFGAQNVIASAPNGANNPVPRCTGNERTVISSNNILISLDQSTDVAMHLGGVRLGGTNWLWQTSPTGNLNGCGNFEISNGITYSGNYSMAMDRQVLYGFHGEFYQGKGEAGQFMHYYDDGLFVGQFGQCSVGQFGMEFPNKAFVGNGFSPWFIKSTNGEYYLWVNDEAQHGPQRWHIINARNIREQAGSGALGSTISLTQQSSRFPTAVSVIPGNHAGTLSWQPVAGATSYNIRYSLLNGGPYLTLAGNTAGTSYAATGLTNGITYYFAVTAVANGVEGASSEQVEIWPFDTSQSVVAVGQMGDNAGYSPTVYLSSTAASSNTPSFIGIDRYTAVLNPRELCYYGFGSLMKPYFGTQGFAMFDFTNYPSTITNFTTGFTLGSASGWHDQNGLSDGYSIDNTEGMDAGWAANPVGTIGINVSDTNYHFLTIVSPAKYSGPKNFTATLTSTNGTSAQYAVNDTLGNNYIFQFLFQGNVTLALEHISGYQDDTILKAIFLDNFGPVGAAGSTFLAAVPLPPTDFHIGTP